MGSFFKATVVAYALSSSVFAKAEPDKLVRSFTLTPGYMERTFNSNEMMKLGPLSLMQFSSKGFDAAVGASGSYKILSGLIYLLPQCWLSLGGNVVYHEFGHARAHASYKGAYAYYADLAANNPDLKTNYAYGLYLRKLLNPSYLLTGAMTSPEDSKPYELVKHIPKVFLDRTIPSSSTKLASILDKLKAGGSLLEQEKNDLKKLYRDFSLYFSVGGLNNNAKYAQSISDIIFKHNGHLLYFTDYFVGKTTPFFYVKILGDSGDVGYIIDGYKAKNLLLEGSDVAICSLSSLFLSSTTWSFVYSAFTELPKSSFIVHAPVWHGWRLPDLNFYLTTQGVSFEVVTGYQFNENWYAGLTTEFVYKGNTAYEFGPSVGYSFNTSVGRFDFSTQLIVSNKLEFGGNAGIEWTSSCKNWTVGLKHIYHNALTLIGERNIPFMCVGLMNSGEPSHTNHEVNLTISFNY